MTNADQPLPQHADETPLAESQAAIDDAKRFAAEHLDAETDTAAPDTAAPDTAAPDTETDAELDAFPGGGDGTPTTGTAPAA
jgi:hypothetical protein